VSSVIGVNGIDVLRTLAPRSPGSRRSTSISTPTAGSPYSSSTFPETTPPRQSCTRTPCTRWPSATVCQSISSGSPFQMFS
jgi:hypothetical protein